MNSKLTKKDQDVLSYIREFSRKENQSPTLEEIKAGLNFEWLNSVQRSIDSLEEKGYLTREKNQTRGIRLTGGGTETLNIPILGTASCGQPIWAEENIEGYIPTQKNLLESQNGKYFYLHAQGDSMDQAGIEDGDLVLVRSQNYADNGEKVVALVDNEVTIKILARSSTGTVLKPSSSNTSHQPIILSPDFRIQGVVEKVISI